jgi:hypothetical protein
MGGLRLSAIKISNVNIENLKEIPADLSEIIIATITIHYISWRLIRSAVGRGRGPGPPLYEARAPKSGLTFHRRDGAVP